MILSRNFSPIGHAAAFIDSKGLLADATLSRRVRSAYFFCRVAHSFAGGDIWSTFTANQRGLLKMVNEKVFIAPKRNRNLHARFLGLFCVVVFLGTVNCMDRKPSPICPVPTKVNYDKNPANQYNGVDLLVVVDNSGSMQEEQQILATGFFTLINSLAKPIMGKQWPYPEVENMRVAIVSSDLGLQYGPQRSTDGFPFGRPRITPKSKGDDGVFKTNKSGTVLVESGQIRCKGDGGQCPRGWACQNELCTSPSGGKEEVNCPELISGDSWAETSTEFRNTDLATQVACMAELGTGGCGIEQQLEASVLALSRDNNQKAFMHEDHLLAVLIVSDEEDCSIKDKGLFSTPEWNSKDAYDENDPMSGLLNTACNLPASNEDYLFAPSRYYNELVRLKNNQQQGVVFAAIVGVPSGNDVGGNSPCEGQGDQLQNCLDHPSMELKLGVIKDGDFVYRHFQPACERLVEGAAVTSARPGRRYVNVAESFGSNGYVYSICNQDWSPAMRDIARVIAQNIGRQCYSDRLEWTRLDERKASDAALIDKHQEACSVGGCGVAKCEIVATFEYAVDSDLGCPAELGLSDADADRIVREMIKDEAGRNVRVKVSCPLPKLPSPLDCNKALAIYENSSEIGWFYCENQGENYEEACRDNFDNDGDTKTDCLDDECADCLACDGTGTTCQSSCRYGVEITNAAKNIVKGREIAVQCVQEFSFEDANCQENTVESCNDGQDNDGNGRFDCIDTINNPEHESVARSGYHFADPNCCPMEIDNGKCRVSAQAFTNCGELSPETIDACKAAAMINQCAF